VRALIHGVSRKDATRLSAKTLDNVTVNFPLVEDVADPRRPWADVRIESASVWGVRGVCVGRAERYDAAAQSVVEAPIDLISA